MADAPTERKRRRNPYPRGTVSLAKEIHDGWIRTYPLSIFSEVATGARNAEQYPSVVLALEDAAHRIESPSERKSQ